MGQFYQKLMKLLSLPVGHIWKKFKNADYQSEALPVVPLSENQKHMKRRHPDTRPTLLSFASKSIKIKKPAK